MSNSGILDFEIAGFPRSWIETKFRLSSGISLLLQAIILTYGEEEFSRPSEPAGSTMSELPGKNGKCSSRLRHNYIMVYLDTVVFHNDVVF
jgi:hypothetical protein